MDARDAGLRVAGNLSIVALEVRNADNIHASGTVTGVALQAPSTQAPLTVQSQDKAAKAGPTPRPRKTTSGGASRSDTATIPME